MKYILIILLLAQFSSSGQKPSIKLETYKAWPSVTNGNLSNDGTFAYYSINNSPIGHNTLVIINPSTGEKTTMKDVSSPTFSYDSKILYGKLPKDTMVIYDLYSKEIKKIGNIYNFNLFKTGKLENIAMLTTDKKLILSLENSKRNKIFDNILDYKVNVTGNAIAIKISNSLDTTNREILLWVDIPTFRSKLIFKAKTIDNIIFDDSASQLAFFATVKNSPEIWCFNNSKPNSTKLVTAKQYNDDKNELDYNIFKFSKDGKFIFFTTTEKYNPIDSINARPIEVWNYKDRYLPTQFNAGIWSVNLTQQNLYSVNLENGITIPLLNENQKLNLNTFNPETDKYIVITKTDTDLRGENLGTQSYSYWLCETRTGLMTEFVNPQKNIISEIQISPNSKYINYYNPNTACYHGYNINTKKTINLSANLKKQLINYDKLKEIQSDNYALGIIGYLGDDENFIVRGTFDLWSISQDSSKAPINLTRGIGSTEGIIFGQAEDSKSHIYKIGDPIILTAFNTNTKEFGFYELNTKSKSKISKLSSGNYSVFTPLNPYGQMSALEFIKAKNKSAFLILRQSADSFPNYYFSEDLVNFKNLSNINPERDYNWLTSELLQYSDDEGNKYTSIIYKPEDFDPNKKYPIIFNYYERYSNGLNLFPKAEPSSVNLNIALAVSNNYIVILPDIKTSRRSSGDEALKTVLSSVKFLSQFAWADTTKMGLMGHSFGGFETNYIISHSNRFAAAVTGAGNAELISMAYDVWGAGGESKESYYQYGPPQMAESLADNPEIYLKNSPILLVKKITTPLLLMHNDQDQAVPFRQSRQLFVALRSLGKPVWLLNYKGEDHGLGKEENIIDYNTKLFGFFDYYLKNRPKPQWMISHN